MTQNESSPRPDNSAANQIRRVLLVVVLTLVTHAATRAGETELKIPNRIHGPIEFLKQNLPQSSEHFRLLLAARRELSAGTGDAAFPALLEIFSQEHDAFSTIHEDRPAASVYELALGLLGDSSPATQRAWREVIEPLAVHALRESSGSLGELLAIARKYPFTETAQTAAGVAATLAKSRGEFHLANAILKQDSIRLAAGSYGPPFGIRAAVPVHGMASHAAQTRPSRLAIPYPESIWDWKLPFWSVSEGTLFADLLKPFHRSRLSLNSWVPLILEDTIYVRTPLHVIAFDKQSGAVRWSIQTDTFAPKANPTDRDTDSGSRVNLGELLRMETLGSLAASERYLFFIDRFRVLEPGKNYQFRFGARRIRPALPAGQPLRSGNAGRLVAVDRLATPKIAWTIGGVAEYPYEVTMGRISEKGNPIPSEVDRSFPSPIEHNSARPVSPFLGQQFCGQPLVFDQMLFVLTFDGSTYWLYCLKQNSGEVRWRRPLADNNAPGREVRGRIFVSNSASEGASLCGVSGDVVVSALTNGIVVGTRVTDGRFLWATNLRREIKTGSNTRLGSILSASLSASPGIRSQPLIRDGKMFWACPYSDNVHCIDTATGGILWKSPRKSERPGRLEGTSDTYVLSANDAVVVTVGARHLRGRNVANGQEVWMTPIRQQTGRCFANESSALVPQIDGTIIQIDLRNGQRQLAAERTFPLEHSVVGSVVADDDVVCLSTPASVTVLPAAFATKSEPHGNLHTARLFLLRGDLESAIETLGRSSHADDEGERQAAHHLLANVLLDIANGTVSVDAVSRESAMTQLRGMDLNQLQTMRLHLTEGFVASGVPNSFAGKRPLVDIDAGWKVRWDVAASNQLPRHVADQLTARDVTFDGDREDRELAILSPGRIGGPGRQLGYAELLQRDRRFTSAELFLLSARRHAQDEEKKIIDDHINNLRSQVAGRIEESVVVLPEHRGVEVEISEELRLVSGSQIKRIRDQSRMQLDGPSWYPHRLFLSSNSLISASMELGIEAGRLRLPVAVDGTRRQQSFESPSYVPVVGRDKIGVVTLLDPNGPRLIWWRPIEREAYEIAPLEIGPYGASYLMVSMGAKFICLHPLTGEVLWSRTTTDDLMPTSGHGRVPRLAGGARVIARFSRNLRSYELYRTSDGKLLDVVSLDISAGQIPLIDGESVLFKVGDRLQLHDLATGTDLLENYAPITILGVGQAQLLSNHRVITMNDDLELVVLNMKTGTVEVRCSVASVVKSERLVGLKAFERSGVLFVVLKDFNSSRGIRSASSRMGELRLESGELVAIGPADGRLLWHRKVAPAVAPKIYGPKSNVMLTWAWLNPRTNTPQQLWIRENSEYNRTERSMAVTAIDVETGQILGEAIGLSPSEPLRCIHDAGAQEIRLESDTSVVRVKYR